MTSAETNPGETQHGMKRTLGGSFARACIKGLGPPLQHRCLPDWLDDRYAVPGNFRAGYCAICPDHDGGFLACVPVSHQIAKSVKTLGFHIINWCQSKN
jgi:hypothetical protein